MAAMAVLAASFSVVLSAQDIELSAVPDQVYKLRDGGKLPTESWMFYLIVNDKRSRDAIRTLEARTELFSAGDLVQTMVLTESTLARLRQRSFTIAKDTPPHSLRRAYSREELFDLPFLFPQVLISWKVDQVRVSLRLLLPDKTETTVTKMIAVSPYFQKSGLIFPIKGPAIITQGMWNNGGHSGYGNQFALDVNALTANYAAMLSDSEDLNAYATWGREVIAPGDGVVVYSRNDVPDNGPGTNPEEVFSRLQDPMLATAGNAVVIDHGNSEYSVLMHMQKGSLRVAKGSKVKKGDIVGLIGSSGDSFGPHLHYQLQSGPELFKYPSLPVTFENLKGITLLRGTYFSGK